MTDPGDRRRAILRLGGLALPVVVTLVAMAAAYAAKAKCHFDGWPPAHEVPGNQFCYSDIPVLFQDRGLIAGIFPYSPEAWHQLLEYPVLTGFVMDLTARLSRAIDPGDSTASALQTYFNVNFVVLVGFALLTVVGVAQMLRLRGRRPGDVLLVAAAPTMILASTINWDLVVVAIAVFALLAWARDRPVLAGVLIGLGTATKLYPLFFLGPILILCMRERRMPPFWYAAGSAVVAWIAVNLPLAVVYPDGWLAFFRFNAKRKADFGSLWYGLELEGHPVPGLNSVSLGLFLLLCAGIGALAWWAPRTPTIEQLCFLVIAAFLVTNKVYSPQYVLWMLPLAVLARAHLPWRPVLRDYAIWQAAEVLYWAAVWGYLDGRVYDSYVLAIVVRLIATVWFAGQVVRDIQIATPPPDPEAVDLRANDLRAVGLRGA